MGHSSDQKEIDALNMMLQIKRERERERERLMVALR